MLEPFRLVPWILGLAVCLAYMLTGHRRSLKGLFILGVISIWSLSSILMWAVLNEPAADFRAFRLPHLELGVLALLFGAFGLAPVIVLVGERRQRQDLVKAGWALPLAPALLLPLLDGRELSLVVLFSLASALGAALILAGWLRQRPVIQGFGWVVFTASLSSFLILVWGLSGLSRI